MAPRKSTQPRTSSKSAASMKLKQKKAKPQEGRDETTGRFVAGNRFWEARSSAGPNPKFATADDLWVAACEYFEWVELNPLWEDRLVTFQGAAVHEPVAKMRAMTIAGLCIFLDITVVTWNEWKKSRSDLSNVIKKIDEIIYSQKFSGAAADLLNANIIARDLGLADKNELTGKGGGPLEVSDVGDRDFARWLAFKLERGARSPDQGSAD